jgi:hypothetical protein
MTMVDPRTKHSREVTVAVRDCLPDDVALFDAAIPVSVKLKESARAGRSIFELEPNGRPAQAYAEFAGEVERFLIERGNRRPGTAAESPSQSRPETKPARPAEPVRSPKDVAPEASTKEAGRSPERGALPPIGAVEEPEVTGVEGTSPARPTTQDADNALIGSGKGPTHFCPKLGTEANPRQHLPMVSHEHRCFADQTPLEISNYAQRLYCLTDRYGTCGRFLRAQMNAQAPASEPATGFLARVRSALNRSPAG